MNIRKIIFLSIGLLYAAISLSQDVKINLGVKDSIQSNILGESRQIVVSLPKGYHTETKSYPALYVLDGDETGLLNAIIVTRKLREEMIIVAIPNVDRDRDMMPLSTPTCKLDNPATKKFLSFIERELIPHIEEKWRTNEQRTIRGASLSGRFVLFAFLENPEVFDNYIGNSAGWYADMNPFLML